MGKKMKLPFLSKISVTNTDKSTRVLWPWPAYCHQPRTLSFSLRTSDGMLKSINSAFLDIATSTNTDVQADSSPTPESWFTNSCESASFSTASDDQSGAAGADSIETVIKGLRSERLFFEPGETNSILEEAKAGDEFPFKESVVLSMESQDPCLDFKKSMEEMVEAHGLTLTHLEGLEELLSCYLKVNGKSNHGYIIGAFVDLLVGLAFASASASPSSSPSSSTTTTRTHQHHHADSPSSPLSFYTSSTSSDDSSTPFCVSSLENEVVDIISPCLTSLEAENGTKSVN